MEEASSVTFAETARALGDQARAIGVLVPAYRSPPRVVGVTRTVRHRADGSVSVAVAFRNRPWPAVVADMIEGIVVANRLSGAAACRVRDDLWAAVPGAISAAA